MLVKMDQKKKKKLIDDVKKKGRLGEVVKAIKDDGADINTADGNGRTLIMWAAWKNRVEVFKWLCANGANLHITDKDGWNVLHFALFHGRLEMVKFLFEKIGSDQFSQLCAVKNNDGETPLDRARVYNQPAVLQFVTVDVPRVSQSNAQFLSEGGPRVRIVMIILVRWSDSVCVDDSQLTIAS